MKDQIKEALKEMFKNGELKINIAIEPNYRGDYDEVSFSIELDNKIIYEISDSVRLAYQR